MEKKDYLEDVMLELQEAEILGKDTDSQTLLTDTPACGAFLTLLCC